MWGYGDTPVGNGTHTKIFWNINNSYMLSVQVDRSSMMFDFLKSFRVLIAEGVEVRFSSTNAGIGPHIAVSSKILQLVHLLRYLPVFFYKLQTPADPCND